LKKQKPFLASSVPNLSRDNLAIDFQGPSGELDANGELGLSRLNSFLVNLESRFDLPTPESPIRTTLKR